MIDWLKVPNFKPEEFFEDPNKYADPELIYALQKFRELSNLPFYPSPVPGALARFSGDPDSQHYAVNRKSTAIDGFHTGYPINTLTLALGCGLFGGIGIYLDRNGLQGKSWVQFHFDVRKSQKYPLIWIVRKEGKEDVYYYPQFSLGTWTLLNDPRMFVFYKMEKA